MNMSYCRFENTLSDFLDCLESLECKRDLERLSVLEREAAKELYEKAKEFIELYEELEE